jgi:hypothetical protein
LKEIGTDRYLKNETHPTLNFFGKELIGVGEIR